MYNRVCDWEVLVAPVLCMYPRCLTDVHGSLQRVGLPVMECVFPNSLAMFSELFDFGKRLQEDVFVLERRELFDALPEMLQGRKSEVSLVSKRMLSWRDQLSQKRLN